MTVLDGAGIDGTGWRSYPSWEVFGQQTPLGCTLAVPVSRHDHWLGARGAPVTVVFYGDYTNAASRSVYADLKQIESLAGRRLAVVYRHLVDLDDQVRRQMMRAGTAFGIDPGDAAELIGGWFPGDREKAFDSAIVKLNSN